MTVLAIVGYTSAGLGLTVGSALGVLIGIISGTVFLLLWKTANRPSDKDSPSILKLTAEILAIPTFWFGSPPFTSAVLRVVPLKELLAPYVVSLVITFAVLLIYPLSRWIFQLGQDIGQRSG